MEIKPAIARLSSVYVGRALTNFINSIDVSETRIGERQERSSIWDDPRDENLVYDGHMLCTGEQGPTWFLTDANKVKITKTKRFNGFFEKSPIECIRDYFNWCEESLKSGFDVQDRVDGGIDRLDEETVIDIVSKIEENKMVIVPFKYDNIKTVVEVEAEGVSTKRDMTIRGIKWKTDNETGELLCNVILNHRGIGSLGKTIMVSITEYGKRFNIEAVTLANSSSRVKVANAIEYEHAGWVKPIELTNGVTSIIIDGTYVYYKNDTGTYIVGEWTDRGLVMKYTNQNDKLFNKLGSYVKVISLHKRIIAPYSLVNTKVINVKTK